MSFDTTAIGRFWQLLLSDVPVILGSSLAFAFFGTPIGPVTVFLRRVNKVFNLIVAVYIDLSRGTPVHVQMFFIYFGIPSLASELNINNWVVGILVFFLNSGAYMSEIMYAGIDGIDKRQIEAAKALGVSGKDIGKDTIISQTFCNVLPVIISEFITLTEETSIVLVTGLYDMMCWFYAAKNQTHADFEPLLIVSLVYYVMNKVLSFIGKVIGRKLKYDQSRAFT